MKLFCTIKHCFTLVELLVVVAIISILAALLLPTLQESVNQAHIAQCMSNLKQIGMATTQYANDNDGVVAAAENGYQSWYRPNRHGFLWNTATNKTVDTYITYNSKVLECPQGLSDATHLGYVLVAMSGSATYTQTHWTTWENLTTGTGYNNFSLSSFSERGMYYKYTEKWRPLPIYSKRILACDVMYAAPAAGGTNGYAPQRMRSTGANHSWRGGSSVFADGHVEYVENPLQRSPTSDAEKSMLMANLLKYATMHWNQRFYIPLSQ